MSIQPIRFSFKVRPFAAETSLELDRKQLRAWRAGKETVIELKDIEAVRLFFSPRNLSLEGYKAKIYTRGGRTLTFEDRTWRSLIDQVYLAAPYRTFVIALCERVARANPDVLLYAGKTPIPYWLTAITGALTAAILYVMVIRSAMAGQWPFALAIGGFATFFAWWSWHFANRNRPRTFRGNAIPADIIPPAKPDTA